MVEAFTLNHDELMARAPELAAQFASADPFPHIVFDGLIPDEVLQRVVAEFPVPSEAVKGDPNQLKTGFRNEATLSPFINEVFHELNGQVMMNFLSAVTGIEALIPDPYLYGGGLHLIRPGGLLKVHTDFSEHPRMHVDRRLNLLVYLNEDWEDSYGGHLELWDLEMTHCVKKVLPSIGTCVLFATTGKSPHGHPDPLTCPDNMARRSIAMYYYSKGAPADHGVREGTNWMSRPGEKLVSHQHRETVNGGMGLQGRDFVPPAFFKIGGRLKRKFKS